MSISFALLCLCIQLHSARAHYHPFDPYAPHDPNNGYPQHFCELNDDEFGRPYLGPYDQHVDASARNPFPNVPAPEDYSSVESVKGEEDSAPTKNWIKRKGHFMKRQLPACNVTIPDECSLVPESCNGTDTQYDSCERRCSCSGGVLTNCCRVRKDWRSMTQAERCRYINAVVTVSTQSQWKPCYDSLIRLHTDLFGLGIHGITFFLPWHRWYILQLENLLRQVDCRVTVPYWDWSLESQNWQNSVIWNATCGFGGNGDQFTSWVSTGPFQYQLWTQPNGDLLTRSFVSNTLPDCAMVATAQRMSVNQFYTWYTTIQGNFHNVVHCNIGGTMCTIDSANDPIFFLHHGFIDRLWSDWQNNGPEYKNLVFYSMNYNSMPGASGVTPANIYDLLNQPGCVKVCVQPPTMACCTNTTYAPVCPRDMNDKHFSPMKLSRLIHRPCPNPSEKAFDLFHATYEDRVVARRFTDLMNDYEQLNSVLSDNGYYNDMPKSYQRSSGFIDYDRYLYRTQSFENNLHQTEVPNVCLPYLYGQA